ncbi:MAG: Mov34/MPN/PAD-1 family protein [Deltaproteobacteria bacterium]|nr:Mov34/MPN/PAD-1 family protein [Deltaproteobacteria bacterium]
MGSVKKSDRAARSEDDGGRAADHAPAPAVKIRDTRGAEKLSRREFPGPAAAHALLRVAMDRGAYAEVVAHAKESLDGEVCGVLVGGAYVDAEGSFVHAEACIRGTATSGGSTHVTFTQDTWNAIHETLERDHPKLRIVGWYHSHPGFGVEFSDMDRFIQQNFFGGPAQIGLLTDPLSGAVAVCANTRDGSDYVSHFWVDGREMRCWVPARAEGEADAAGGAAPPRVEVAEAVHAIEGRISQLVVAIEDLRASYHRFLLTSLVLVCVGIVTAVGWFVYDQMTSRIEPPRLNSYMPIPVRFGGRTVLLGVAVAEWQVPPELNALLLERAARARALATATASASSGPPPHSSAPPVPSSR